MTTVLCTLYNSLYLDKGLVLYDSLCECAKDFKLYVLCMDDKCYEVLTDLHQDNHIPIRLTDFEKGDNKLLEAKSNRSFGEYCWTCTSSLIKYIFNEFEHEICTYIDADMYFYQDPQILVDEMLATGKSVMMVPHRFTERNRHLAEIVGTYCVEFNTFKNDNAGRDVLNNWHEQCLECCSNLGDGVHWGDQKYMDEWPVRYPDDVHVCENIGAGVATWNIELYKSSETSSIEFYCEENKGSLVFYHFAGILYYSRYLATINIRNGYQNIDYHFVRNLYMPYLLKIENKRKLLQNGYGLQSMRRPPRMKSLLRKKLFESRLYTFICDKVFFNGLHLPYVLKLK